MTWVTRPAPKPRKSVKGPKPLRARKRLRSYNAKRKGHKFPKLVDESRRAHCRTFPCAPCLATGQFQDTPTQACHLKSRGAGGPDEGNLWPGCARHHIEQHVDGIVTFQRRCHVNLRRICERVEAAYVRVSSPTPKEPL